MKISVIIPAYNEEKTIFKAIKSILESSYKNYEIIVVDNGSKDNTSKIISGVKSKKLKYFFYDKKKGPAEARNFGANKAKGDILFFLDADDWLKKDTLYMINKEMLKYPNNNLFMGYRKNVFCNDYRKIWSFEFYRYIDSEIKEFGNNKSKTAEKIYSPWIYRKDFFLKKIGGFKENAYYFEEDYIKEKIKKLKEPIILLGNTVYYSDMGSSFDDFFKRAKNIGKGIAITKNKKLIFNLFLTNLFFIAFINPLIFIFYYAISFIFWHNKSKSLLVALSAPFLWILKKIITFAYIVKFSIK